MTVPAQAPAVVAHTESTTDTPASRPAPTKVEVDALIHEHLPLVGHLVRDVLSRVPAHVDRDDLVSAGMLGLVLAARSFDGALGVPFSRFAALRIRGAITDALRSMDRAGRGLRGKARQIDTVHNTLAATLGRTPTRLEVAQAMGLAVTELDTVAADVHRASLVSLQASTGDRVEESLPSQAENPEQLILKREKIGYLHDAVAELPDRLRTVVQRSFFEQHRMIDIAADLGVTESRVSQLRSEALALLRTALHTIDSDQPRSAPHNRAAARRASYVQAVATRSTTAERLQSTTLHGDPRPRIPAAS